MKSQKNNKMVFEIERASVRLLWFEEDKRTENEILEELDLPKGYKVRVDMNHEGREHAAVYIELDTLEDLMKFMHKIEEDVVICYKENKIIIYDDYLE